jgi:hypothetical protein
MISETNWIQIFSSKNLLADKLDFQLGMSKIADGFQFIRLFCATEKAESLFFRMAIYLLELSI